VRKLLSSAVAYVVKYTCLLDTRVCLCWWVVFSLAVFSAACLVKLLKLINLIGRSIARETVTN
jgi:hypothetical protein